MTPVLSFILTINVSVKFCVVRIVAIIRCTDTRI